MYVFYSGAGYGVSGKPKRITLTEGEKQCKDDLLNKLSMSYIYLTAFTIFFFFYNYRQKHDTHIEINATKILMIKIMIVNIIMKQ